MWTKTIFVKKMKVFLELTWGLIQTTGLFFMTKPMLSVWFCASSQARDLSLALKSGSLKSLPLVTQFCLMCS